MDLIVCMKRVPDSAARIQIAADGKSIETGSLEHVISPYDEMALERALQLQEEHGGSVTVACLGPAAATKEIRQALAMGAGQAVHLRNDAGYRDPLTTASLLADALRGRPYDLLLFGRQSIDADNSAVGVMVAGLLGLPAVTLATKIEIADGRVVVHREAEGGTEVVEVALPVVVTAQRGLAEPRYPSIKGIMQAKKKPVEEIDATSADITVELERLDPPPERTGGRIVGEGVEAVPELVRLLRSEAKVL
ncbi:MAG: electron transfer flavoprotein subunit beta/FixA family protein [Planctomycetota bacterium]